ncbi:ABC-2 family transporter protein [Ruminococcus flavefaciens]|uniref:ABC-2 family transporter protein n=1 Tax=Ruminococcus flavefaciens TaxID=1265 RepID=A0A1H6ICI8_RUMFL|nr:ABC-2 transporter permease [Ruminococcus flavefaciens]SEH44838.1 ABC-2 family transporter protein [Ruminococcus flavefaciens]
MKGLIYREFYLMRKNFALTLAVFLGFLFMISLVFISTYAGNLAKGEENNQMIASFYPQAYLYTGAMALLGFSAAQNGVVYDDYKSRWRLYTYTLPVDEKKMASSMLVSRIILLVVSFLFAVVGEVVLGLAAKKGVSLEHIKNLAVMAAIVSVTFITLPSALRHKEVSKTITTYIAYGIIPFAALVFGIVKFIIYCIKEAEVRYPNLKGEEAIRKVSEPYQEKLVEIAAIAAPFIIVGSLVLCYFRTVKELERRRY